MRFSLLFEDAMNEATVSFQVDASLKEQFTAAANACGCSDAQLMIDFMRDFVGQRLDHDADALFRRHVEAGLESANAGMLISSEEVEEEFAARREKTRRKLATHA
jgi:predicted transcriptional regulator